MGGGGGNDGIDVIKYRLDSLEKRYDRLDVRLNKVDVKLDKIDNRHDRDFRVIFSALIAATLGLAGLMAKGFHWLQKGLKRPFIKIECFIGWVPNLVSFRLKYHSGSRHHTPA